ncbi:hypothetical protein [Magnetospirillum sp. UT-4]|uniref:hypothetical protein n=1 Tax=Magnetospirillum sp. UT-4 TaxID=2681467 RepID=UPI001384CB06|nr:hypothetical protein [Magnetospirillum sp. UT-4]CAA7622769.1 conserved exported hypothetical protein [Magnetospirillum sp. UT-4]
MSKSVSVAARDGSAASSVVLGTGLTLASLILVPALSQAVGLGPSLTSALRIVLMKAAARV